MALDAWEHLPPLGDGWVWDTYSGTVLCHKSPQERRWSPDTAEVIPPGLTLKAEGPGSGHWFCVQTSAKQFFISGLKI